MDSIFARCTRDVSICPNFIAGCRAPVVRTALSKVKRGFGRSFVPDDSESFRELTPGARFDMLAP
jgi:hypothetical protein